MPYKGNAPAINDLLGGQSTHDLRDHADRAARVKAGKLRAIAVIGAARAAALPDTPTVAETLPGFEVSNWIGLFMSPGTPMDIVIASMPRCRRSCARRTW